MEFALSQRYVTTGLNLLMVAVIAGLLALSVNDVIKLHLASEVVPPEPDASARLALQPAASTPRGRNYYDAIVQRDIFNLAPARVETTAVTNEDLQIKLLGTSQVSDGKPFMIVEDAGGDQSLYQLGDTIPNAGRVIEIWRDRAVVLHNGHRVAIAIPRDEMNSPDADPLVPSTPTRSPFNNPMIRRPHQRRSRVVGRRAPEGVHQVGPTRYVIDRSAVDSNLQNMAKLFTEIRAIPNLQNGASNGFRLSEIQPGSIFDEIGLQDGDVLTTIQGQNLGDPTQAVALLSSLRSRSSISLNVIRNGMSLRLFYNIH